MTKLKWKKGDIDLCSPSLERSTVSGYIYGELAIHKIPESSKVEKRSDKDPIWTITHIKTGTRIAAQRQPPFRTLAEAKEFAGRLMHFDTWYIEDAEFGDTSKCSPERVSIISEVLKAVLTEYGYKVDVREYSLSDKEVILHMCECGKVSKRYIRSTDKEKKWKHKCLDCEPCIEGEADG